MDKEEILEMLDRLIVLYNRRKDHELAIDVCVLVKKVLHGITDPIDVAREVDTSLYEVKANLALKRGSV